MDFQTWDSQHEAYKGHQNNPNRALAASFLPLGPEDGGMPWEQLSPGGSWLPLMGALHGSWQRGE